MTTPMRETGTKVVATNRKARRNYEILDTIEAGLVLRGSRGEVDPRRQGADRRRLRPHRRQRRDLAPQPHHRRLRLRRRSTRGHDEARKRKLLLHGHEIERLRARVDPEHLSLIPLSVYFKDGRAKVELALAKGRKTHDKRQAIAERDANLDLRRAMAHRDRD